MPSDRRGDRILVSGSSGLIGSSLVPELTVRGYDVDPLVRTPPGPSEEGILWDPDSGKVDDEGLEGADAVVHLAGEPIDERWTSAQKEQILRSREEGTRLLAETLAGLEDPPDVLVSASAVGYYGDRGDEVLTEDKGPGDAFLSDVCQQWEAACDPAREAGIRVVNPRTGIVLSTRGGALDRMLLPFRLGLGGRVGPGDQWWPWITLTDEVRALIHLIENDLEGPVNLSAPNPVRNERFVDTLGDVLGRPTVFPLPAFVARVVFGEMADELLLASQRMEPARLEKDGFDFDHPELEEALESVLARS